MNHAFHSEGKQQNLRTYVENVHSKLRVKDKVSLGNYTFLVVSSKWSLLLHGNLLGSNVGEILVAT